MASLSERLLSLMSFDPGSSFLLLEIHALFRDEASSDVDAALTELLMDGKVDKVRVPKSDVYLFYAIV